MSSHALLLRLFLSSSFFSVHVALKYLLFYADNIGITYYLTRRLRELDINELRDVWGFICHLLVTRPSKSRALECFVVEIAQKSTHVALITLWFMQATLSDLSMQRDSQSFAICQRVLHKCHEIVFGDQLLPSSSPYSGFNLPAFTRRRKVNHHAEPIFVGLGVLLASAPAMPQLVDITGQIAIEQGRAEDEGVVVRGFQLIHDEELYSASSGYTPTDETDDHDMSSGPDEDFPSPLPPKIVESTNIRSLGRRRTLGAQTLPALPLHLQTIRKPRLSESDPLGQLDSESSGTPYQSSPSLPSARTPSRVAAANKANLILEKYDDQAQMHLLRGHYYISEVQFLLSLENICNRLVIVPKPARVSALRAELTALNHKLPAEVCMPMWCSSVDSAAGRKFPTPHHRIVRIPPGEAVVLNSAERAPYLLLIEILSDDLDFDSSKRANKDILRKLVTKKVEQRDGWTNFGLSSSNFWKDTLPDSGGASTSLLPPSADPTTAGPSSTALTNDDEEIDLVEQLYGDDQPLRSRVLDIEDSIVLPPTPKNKELDMATWARSSPHISQHFDELRLGLGMPGGQHFSTYSMSRTNSISPSNSQMSHGQSEPIHMISLDEYSERMRTAAIMLAQLNADQGREQAPSTPKLNGASRSDNLLDRSGRQSGPGTSGEVPQPMASRMKLPRAEAHAIRDRIMKEMLSLEEERMERMKGSDSDTLIRTSVASGSSKSAEDEGIIRRELNKVDPSAVVFSESWAAKKSRIRHGSPYGHLANWECVSVIVKTGGDLRQEQLAVQLIREFQQIWTEEKCSCWVKYFRILITGSQSGLVETITDAVSIHSIKKAEYAKRLASGRLGHVTLMDHFISTYGEPSSAKFARAQKNFAKSLAGYSIVTYLLQVKDRHNGNILIDRDGHLIHIDFGFILSNTPGNIGFEAAPFKFPPEYVEVLGGITGPAFLEFKKLFREGFEAARKHCDRIITLVELMQKDSMLPCFAVSGVQTANQLRERFQSTLTHALVGDYVNRLIDSSLGSHWTRLYDSYQYYSQSIL